MVVRTVSEYSFAMSSAAAVTKATATEMVQLEQVTRQLGATTMFSASQAAEGAKFLGMAGFTTNQILEALPATLDLAAAASIDMGQAADITSNIMSGFGLAASEAGRAADVLASIASSANTDVTGMGQAMNFVGPVAKSLGITMEETAAAIGVLANNGLQGGIAGRQLRTSLASLVKPSKDAQKTLAEMGISLNSVNPQMHSLQEVVKALAGASMTAEQAFRIFGNEGATAMLALTASVPDLERLTGATQNASGEAARMAKIMRDNLRGDAEILKSALSELALQIGEMGVTGAIRSMLQAGTDAAAWLSDSLKLVKENEIAYLALNTSVELLAFSVGTLLAMKAGVWFFEIATALKAATAASTLFAASLWGIPFTWVAAAIALLGFAIYKIATNWEYVGEVTHNTIMSMVNTIKRFGAAVIIEFGAAANFMVNRLEWVKEFAITAGKQAFYSATNQTQKFAAEQKRFADFTRNQWKDAWLTDDEREKAIDSMLGVKAKDQVTKAGIGLFRAFRDAFKSGGLESAGQRAMDYAKAMFSSMSGAIPSFSGVQSSVPDVTPKSSGISAVTPEVEKQEKAFWGVKDAVASTFAAIRRRFANG